MMWSDKAFRIYFGTAGEGIAPARSDDATDGTLHTQARGAYERGSDVTDARNGGWLTRTFSELADRAALTRIARS